MINYVASPRSINEIRDFANKLRRHLKIKLKDPIDASTILDKVAVYLEKQGIEFCYEILEDRNPIFENKEEAFTLAKEGTIYLKESVFIEVCTKKYCRSTYTIAHELGHFFFNCLFNTRLTRTTENEIKPYENPEWQANTFASEFLMPFSRCKNLTAMQIKEKYNVSLSAAETRYNKIHNIKNNIQK